MKQCPNRNRKRERRRRKSKNKLTSRTQEKAAQKENTHTSGSQGGRERCSAETKEQSNRNPPPREAKRKAKKAIQETNGKRQGERTKRTKKEQGIDMVGNLIFGTVFMLPCLSLVSYWIFGYIANSALNTVIMLVVLEHPININSTFLGVTYYLLCFPLFYELRVLHTLALVQSR